MTIWHETVEPKINHVFEGADGRVRAVIEWRDHFGGVYALYFMRWRGEGRPLLPRLAPHEWQELWPRAELTTTTLQDAKVMVHSLMAQVASGEADDRYEIGPCRRAQQLERVQEKDHPSGRLRAILYRHSPDKYEVRYFVHELLGVWRKSNTEEWDWCRTRFQTTTFADSLADAERAALEELEQLALPE